MRAVSSNCSQRAGEGLGGTSLWSRKARFNCMVALLARHRLDVSVVESVHYLAEVEQIAKPAESMSIARRHCLFWAPIRPAGRNERTAAVWQADEQKQDAAASDAADHRQVLTLDGVALAGDRHPIRKITVMGSLWPVPLGP